MKYIFLLAALTVAGMASAQTPKTDRETKSPEEKAAMMTKKMTEKLSLTPEQVAQIEPENLAFFRQQAVHQEQMKALRNQQKQHGEQHKEKIKSILTPEQQKKAEEIMEDRKEKRQKKMKRGMNR